MLPHNYIVSLAEQIARAWQRTADDVVLTPLPLFHFNAISIVRRRHAARSAAARASSAGSR